MARYIDADNAKDLWRGEHPTQIAMRRIFDDLPTADVVEVVRCFQCRFGEVDDMSGRVMCNSRYAPWHRYKEEFTFSPNDFCRLGERKE